MELVKLHIVHDKNEPKKSINYQLSNILIDFCFDAWFQVKFQNFNFQSCCFIPSGTEHLHGIQGDAIMDNDMTSGSEETLTEQSTVKRDEVVGLDDIILSEEPELQEDKQHRNQVEEMKGIEERTDMEEERTAQDYSESQKQPKEAELDSTEIQVDDEDEGIGLDGNELDDINRREKLQEELYPATDIADRTAIREEGS